MKKIIKLLKEEVSKLRGYAVIIDGEDGEWKPVTTVSVEDIYELINQLDELEVLSQELSVIPKFVADWIEGNKQFEEKWNDYSKEDAMSDTIHFTIYGLFADYPVTNSHVELRKPVLKWLSVDRGNYFKLVNAVRYGYEEEEEQKYHVRDKHGVYLLAKNQQADGRVETVAEIVEFYGVEEVELDYELTEQEIKDYDERYMNFAVKVEELEE